MVKEKFLDFGQDPDGDAMSMESEPIHKQVLDHILKLIREKHGWKTNTSSELGLEDPLNEQKLL